RKIRDKDWIRSCAGNSERNAAALSVSAASERRESGSHGASRRAGGGAGSSAHAEIREHFAVELAAGADVSRACDRPDRGYNQVYVVRVRSAWVHAKIRAKRLNYGVGAIRTA